MGDMFVRARVAMVSACLVSVGLLSVGLLSSGPVAAGMAADPVNPRPTVSLVADVTSGLTSSLPSQLVEWQGELAFTGVDRTAVRRLFMTTAQGAPVRPVLPPGQSLGLGQVDSAGGHLFVVASGYDSSGSRTNAQLWVVDAVGAPAVQVSGLTGIETYPGTISYPSIHDMVAVGDHLYFSVVTAGEWELWRSDGTPGGTGLVRAMPAGESRILDLVAVGDRLFFTYGDRSGILWTSDGTAEGTREVAVGGTPRSAGEMLAVGDRLLFTTSVPGAGSAVALTDGTSGGTTVLWQEGAETAVSPDGLAHDGGLVHFTLDDSEHDNVQVWRSDGTRAGTTAATDWLPLGRTRDAVATSGRYYLAVSSNGLSGEQLYVMSEADDELSQVMDFATAVPRGYIARQLEALNGWVFFAGWDEDRGNEVWASDGTPAGTQVLGDLCRPSASVHCEDLEPTWLTPLGDSIFFAHDTANIGTELWKSTPLPLPVLAPPPVVVLPSPSPSVAPAPPVAATTDERLDGLTVRARRTQEQGSRRVRIVLRVGATEVVDVRVSARLRVGRWTSTARLASGVTRAPADDLRRVVLEGRGRAVRNFLDRLSQRPRTAGRATIVVRATDESGNVDQREIGVRMMRAGLSRNNRPVKHVLTVLRECLNCCKTAFTPECRMKRNSTWHRRSTSFSWTTSTAPRPPRPSRSASTGRPTRST